MTLNRNVSTIFIDDIAQFLDRFFAVHDYTEDVGGIYQPSTHPIRRIGLALEPWPHLADWVNSSQLEALFLHRPWKLELAQLNSNLGIISYHLAFDERLTLGFNSRLAEVLGLSAIKVFGEKSGRPIGMIGEIQTTEFAEYSQCISEIFGGRDSIFTGSQTSIRRVAVVGAMTDNLIREAATHHANLYITGQWRKPAEGAVRETQLNVIAVGHRRCEEWGLRALAGILQERWANLEVVLPTI